MSDDNNNKNDLQNQVQDDEDLELDKPSAKRGKKEYNGEKAPKKNWFQAKYAEYLAEFRKIVWPSRQELIKQTITVIVVSLLFGAYIAALDGILGSLFTQFANLIAPAA